MRRWIWLPWGSQIFFCNDPSDNQDSAGEPIRGLFAAGEIVGGLYYHNYGAGTGLVAGTVFGRLAGDSAARFVRR